MSATTLADLAGKRIALVGVEVALLPKESRGDAVSVSFSFPPVAHRRPKAQVPADGARVVERALETCRECRLGAVHLLCRRRLIGEALQGCQHRLDGFAQVAFPAHFGSGKQHAGFLQPIGQNQRIGGEAGLDHVLVESPRGLRAQQMRQHLDRGELFVGTARHVIGGHGVLNAAHPPQRHRALTVLGGLGGVGLEQPVGAAAIRARDRAELLLDEIHRPLRVETARDHEDRVVGLVVFSVERLQAFDGHVLDVGSGADGRVAVVVPQEGRGQDALLQNRKGTVFAALPLVADHGHLGLEVFGGDVRIDHAVRFDVECPGEVVFVGRERLVVAGAVEERCRVVRRATLGEFAGATGMVRRAFENQVFEQVRHAGFAVAFVPRTHPVGDVDGDLLLAPVGRKQEPKAVVESVLGDTFDGRHLGCAGRRRPGWRIVHFPCRDDRGDPEGKRTEDEDPHHCRDVCSHGLCPLARCQDHHSLFGGPEPGQAMCVRPATRPAAP